MGASRPALSPLDECLPAHPRGTLPYVNTPSTILGCPNGGPYKCKQGSAAWANATSKSGFAGKCSQHTWVALPWTNTPNQHALEVPSWQSTHTV